MKKWRLLVTPVNLLFMVGTAIVLFSMAAPALDSVIWSALSWGGLLSQVAAFSWLGWTHYSTRADLPADEPSVEQAIREAELELRQQADLLEQRQRELTERYLHFESIMEFPLEGLRAADVEDADTEPEDAEVDLPNESAKESQHRTESRRREREVTEFLQAEAERLFDRVKANEFSVDGKVDLEEVRRELMHVIFSVAKIFNPESENPLLETSVEQLLRAASRLCLHLLVLLERLPVNVASYNLQSLYTYLRRAFTAYKAYQQVKPVLPYVQYATYAGRLALGANPITLGASWAIWKLGAEGASAATKHLVNRQAVGFLNDAITIVGYEVAGLYGTDLRLRNKHWIYACELTELLRGFPITRESLVAAMLDIGELPLRNEYDRVFVFRLLAAHRSAGPQHFTPQAELDEDEKKWVAKRLERHYRNFLQGRNQSRAQGWVQGVQKRLGVQLNVEIEGDSISEKENWSRLSELLAKFALQYRQVEQDQITGALKGTKLFERLSHSEQAEIIKLAIDDIESEFDLPDLEPGHRLAIEFMEDLAKLSARTASEAGVGQEHWEWIGSNLGLQEKALTKIFEAAMREEVQRRACDNSLIEKAPAEVDQLLLGMGSTTSKIRFLYRGPWIELDGKVIKSVGTIYLLGCDQACILVSWQDAQPKWLWEMDGTVSFETSSRWMQAQATITGGTWKAEEFAGGAIQIRKGVSAQGDSIFAPLSDLIASQNGDH